MATEHPTWSVVATVDEPPALVQAFVAWHLSLGASEILLYFDRPDDPAAAFFAHLPKVTVVRCDGAHWLRLGKSRPHRHQVRQVENAREAYARTGSGWLLHMDADEFVWPRVPVAGTLAAVAPAVDSLILPVAERIYPPDMPGKTIFEGVFRRPFLVSRRGGRAVFGPDYDLSYRGLTGHSLGKAFVRTGRDVRMSIHRPSGVNRHVKPHIARIAVDDAELLHFDGLTPKYWIFKLMRMAEALLERDGMPPAPHRQRQADALLVDPAGAPGVHDRLKLAPLALQALLHERGLLSVPSFDPLEALAQYFPDASVDLSPDAVDRWLDDNKADILAFMHS